MFKITKEHKEKSEEVQTHLQVDTESHCLITRDRACAERKHRCFISPTRYHDLQSTSKSPRNDDDMGIGEIEMNDSLSLSNIDKYGLMGYCMPAFQRLV